VTVAWLDVFLPGDEAGVGNVPAPPFGFEWWRVGVSEPSPRLDGGEETERQYS